MAANDVSKERVSNLKMLAAIGAAIIGDLDNISDGMKQGLWGQVVRSAESFEKEAGKFTDLCKRMAKTEAQAKIQIPPR